MADGKAKDRGDDVLPEPTDIEARLLKVARQLLLGEAGIVLTVTATGYELRLKVDPDAEAGA